MRSFIPTVEEIAFGKLTEPSRLVDTWHRVDPTAMTDFAIAHLARRGVKLIGDPTLVAAMKVEEQKAVEAELDAVDTIASARPSRVGRPRSTIERDVIAAAACAKFQQKGLGPTAARREAAKLLGSTVSRIEKGTNRFVQQTSMAHKVMPEQAVTLGALFLFHVMGLLDECVAERRAMMGRPRRYSA